MGETYAAAGVDTDAGERAVELISERVASTFRPEVIGGLGSFGGLFAFDKDRYRDPVLVSATDGVGTKAMVATAAGRYDTIGLDLVAMCVDDIVCQGAEPLFFLDYISVGHLDPAQVEQLVAGVAAGCREVGCALIGGEMAEHPGAMEPGEFDLVGFAVGVVERDRLITGSAIAPGDALIGLESPNLRSNGYSLARRILFERAGRSLDDPAYEGADHSLADELLSPSVLYAPALRQLMDQVDVRGLCHVTGGGLAANLTRILGESVSAVVDRRSWEAPRIFAELQRLGEVSDAEMGRAFNMGVGMVAVVPAAEVSRSLEVLAAAGRRAFQMGEVTRGDGSVRLEG